MKKLILGSGKYYLDFIELYPKVNQNLLDLPDPTIEDIVKSYKKQFQNGLNRILIMGYNGKNFPH